MNRVIYNLLLRKITIAKWQLNLFGFLIFSCGALFGLYVLGNEIIIPRLFAASSPRTQTDWSNGEYLSINDIDTTSSGQFNLLDVGEKFTNTDFEIDLSSWNMPVLSSGGTITTSGNYRIHTFKSSGIFETPYSNNVEVIVTGKQIGRAHV